MDNINTKELIHLISAFDKQKELTSVQLIKLKVFMQAMIREIDKQFTPVTTK
jgi:hypothetical protein